MIYRGLEIFLLTRSRRKAGSPKSGHWNSVAECPLCATSGHSALQTLGLFDHLVDAGKKDGGKLEFQLSSDTKVYRESEAVGKLDW